MTLIRTLVAAAALAAIVGAQTGGDVALRAAIETETVKGDLKTALRLYEEIAAKYAKSDRATAASALIRLAQCHEKMGHEQAEKIYERIVREYGDQKEAATVARTKLVPRAASPRGGMIARQLWTMAPNEGLYIGGVSPDGRYVPFTNWSANGDLYLHDLQTGGSRRLTDTGKESPGGARGSTSDFAGATCFSPDGKQLAYAWLIGNGRRTEIRIVDLESGGVPKSRTLFNGGNLSAIVPTDWSPDGKSIAVRIEPGSAERQIGLLSLADGSLRVLKSVGRGTGRFLFSPDGRYLAFDAPARNTVVQHDIFMFAVDGSYDSVLAADPANDLLVGWSPDGRHLLFTSDRAGFVDLWAIPVRAGLADGPAARLKQDIGETFSRGLSRSGAFFYQTASRSTPLRQAVRIATVDFESGKITPLNIDAPDLSGTVGAAAWSPDGKYLVYNPALKTGGNPTLVFRSIDDDQVRILQVKMVSFGVAATAVSAALSPSATSPWWRDGRSILVGGTDLNGRHGLFRVDVQNGNATLLVEGAHPYTILGHDGNHIYCVRTSGAAGQILLDINLTTKTETVLMRRPRFGFMSLSPDGRHIGIMASDDAVEKPASPMTLFLVPVTGGEPRALFRAPQLGAVTFSADGRYIATGTSDVATNNRVVMLIPVQGGEPRELMREPESTAEREGRQLIVALWATDSRSIFLESVAKGRPPVVWRVPVDGGPPKKIEAEIERTNGAFRVSPDGRHLAYNVDLGERPAGSSPSRELWVLENFLPGSAK